MMTQPQQGFVLSRHWRDTPEGTEVAFWLATDAGPRQVRLPSQESVAFIPAEQRAWAEPLLRVAKGVELDELLIYRKRLRWRLDNYQRNVPPHMRAARLPDKHNQRLGRPLQCQRG